MKTFGEFYGKFQTEINYLSLIVCSFITNSELVVKQCKLLNCFRMLSTQKLLKKFSMLFLLSDLKSLEIHCKIKTYKRL